MTAPTSETDLLDFIRSAKAAGTDDAFIVKLLEENGWPEHRIYRAFSALYGELLGTPVPGRPRRSESARDAFYYLLNFITLAFWTTALGQIFYTLIARWLPDAASNGYTVQSLRDTIAWQTATLVVAFPLFAYVHSLIGKELRARPDLYDSGIRKWLTYIALVIAALIVLSDAIWFIEALLRGELTMRFLLDSLVLAVLGGGVFAYYLSTIDPPVTRA